MLKVTASTMKKEYLKPLPTNVHPPKSYRPPVPFKPTVLQSLDAAWKNLEALTMHVKSGGGRKEQETEGSDMPLLQVKNEVRRIYAYKILTKQSMNRSVA